MNKYVLWLLMAIVFKSAWCQSIGQLTITPANPTPADTIYVITTITYSGNCTYGLVYSNTTVSGNTVQIMPTYCGYGATTACTGTDTLKIAPLPIGNYVINIEYHQGSVCPISGFDVVIGQADTVVSVNNIVATQIISQPEVLKNLTMYPNPANDHLTIDLPELVPGFADRIIIRNVMGRALIYKKADTPSMVLDLGGLPSGIYTVEYEGSRRGTFKQRVVVLR